MTEFPGEDRIPDSYVNPHQAVRVTDTSVDDNPAYGAVTVVLDLNARTSTSLRMSKATAASLLHQLATHLGKSCETCSGHGVVGRMTFEGGDYDTCPTCSGLGVPQ